MAQTVQLSSFHILYTAAGRDVCKNFLLTVCWKCKNDTLNIKFPTNQIRLVLQMRLVLVEILINTYLNQLRAHDWFCEIPRDFCLLVLETFGKYALIHIGSIGLQYLNAFLAAANVFIRKIRIVFFAYNIIFMICAKNQTSNCRISII